MSKRGEDDLNTQEIAKALAEAAAAKKRTGEWDASKLPAAARSEEMTPEKATVTLATFLSKLDRTTLAALVFFAGLLTTKADKWWAGQIADEETHISKAVDKRIELLAGTICQAKVDELRGEVEADAQSPPTVRDLADKQRENQMRVWRIEERLRMGEWRRERDAGN